jgi:hypothetical protein
MTEAGGKLFKGLWLTGGFEMNYWSRIAGNATWKELAWEKSGLVGVTKSTKVGKGTYKMQVLVDLMQLQNGDPGKYLMFRLGKGF